VVEFLQFHSSMMPTVRSLFVHCNLLFFLAAGGSEMVGEETPQFSFGAIADCQYCDCDGTRRQYRLSPEKLMKCVEDLNTMELTHVMHLGDFIDKDWESFDVVLPIMGDLKAPVRHVLGNHDFSVADEFKNRVPKRLGLRKRYYDFAIGKWRFLVLDTNDVSLYAYPAGSRKAKESEAIYESLGGTLPKYNGGIGKKQLAWIARKLKAAQTKGESVILHSHHPVYPFESHVAWNAEEIVALIEEYDCVAAYINGHNHAGAYGFKKGVHYLTLKGMVDTEETAYSVISVYPDLLKVKGTGRQDDYVLEVVRR